MKKLFEFDLICLEHLESDMQLLDCLSTPERARLEA